MTRGTQSEQARREGVNRSTIHRRVKSGKQDVGAVSNELANQQRTEQIKKQMGGQ